MSNIVIFSDTSLSDNEELWKSNLSHGDIIFELPAKSAGPHTLATEIRNLGLTCQVIDLCFYFTPEEILKVCEKYITKDTYIVGLSTTFWLFGMNDTKREIIRKIVKYTRTMKTPKLAVGGTMASHFTEKIKPDITIDGFAEDEFIQYIKSIGNIDTEYKHDFNTSKITYLENDFIDYNESTVIETARGCIFKCDFCSYPLNGKKKLDYIKEKETLRSELEDNFNKYGIDTYTLSDDTFNDSTEKLEHIYDVISQLNFNVKFVCYLRLDLLNAHREQIDLLHKMGLKGAFFGVETFNHASGKSIGKGLHPDKQKELLFDLKDKYWKNDVNITIGLISGLPFESIASHKETINWILSKDCNLDRIRPSPLYVANPLIDKYPYKSTFQLNASKFGFYWPDPASHNWKSLSGEIKSFGQALDMSREIYDAAKERMMVYRGNFSLPLVHNIAKYDNLNIDDLMAMDINKYVEWYFNNRHRLMKMYIDAYKKRVLSP
jgi:hypothetical protein